MPIYSVLAWGAGLRKDAGELYESFPPSKPKTPVKDAEAKIYAWNHEQYAWFVRKVLTFKETAIASILDSDADSKKNQTLPTEAPPSNVDPGSIVGLMRRNWELWKLRFGDENYMPYLLWLPLGKTHWVSDHIGALVVLLQIEGDTDDVDVEIVSWSDVDVEIVSSQGDWPHETLHVGSVLQLHPNTGWRSKKSGVAFMYLQWKVEPLF